MKLLYIGIFIAVILIISAIFFLLSKGEKSVSKMDESFCNDITLPALNYVCQLVFSKDINSCKDVESNYETFCYETLADTANITRSVCEGIENDYGKFICSSRLAVKLDDPELCKGNSNCYTTLAVSTKNYTVCDLITFDQDKYRCMAEASKKTEYCNNIGDEFERKLCIGLAPNSIEDCKIGDYYNSECLYNIAQIGKDSTACNLISLDQLKWKCIIDVGKNPLACDSAPQPFDDFCKIEYLRIQMMN